MKSLNVLVKPVSGGCDMRCGYCFYADERRLREKPAPFERMKPETLETLTEKILSKAEESCTFCFQGGEPTLAGLDFFCSAVELQKKYNVNGVKISNSIQTNGIHIDSVWAEFLSLNRFLTGLSLDGPKELHDALRVDAGGKGTFSRVMKAAETLKKAGAEFNILCVVNGTNVRHPARVYEFFRKNGFSHLQFIPCLDGFDGKKQPYSLEPEQYGRFLNTIFDLWYRDCLAGGQIRIRQFDNYIAMLLGMPPDSCENCGGCRAYLTLESDGGCYPCDFYTIDGWRLGNINENGIEEMLSGETAKRFEALSRNFGQECLECPYRLLCRGGCRRRRENGEGELKKDALCAAYRIFFEYAAGRLCTLADGIAAGGRRTR